MGKCVGKYRRVVHGEESLVQRKVYDKHGNLVSEVAQKVEVSYAGRSIMLTNKINVKL